jgi:hypothetical protein
VGFCEVEVGCGDSHVGKDVPGSSTCLPRDYNKGSVKNKATRILVDSAGAVSPWMRRSFVDR